MTREVFAKNSGLTVGSVIGLIGFFVMALPLDEFTSWSFGDALMFGLLSGTAGIVWDIQKDIRRRSEAKDRATRLMIALEGSELDEDPLVVLCESAGKIRNMPFLGYVKDDMKREIGVLSKQLDDLADDRLLRIRTEAHLMDYINAFSDDTKGQLRATSAVDGVDVAIWESGYGQDYLQKQKAIVARGGTVRRIFFTERAAFSSEAIAWMTAQEEYGVQVGALVDASANPTRVEDFIVFDDHAVVLTHLSPGGQDVEGGVVMFRSEDIDKYTDRYERWWPRAEAEWKKIRPGESKSQN